MSQARKISPVPTSSRTSPLLQGLRLLRDSAASGRRRISHSLWSFAFFVRAALQPLVDGGIDLATVRQLLQALLQVHQQHPIRAATLQLVNQLIGQLPQLVSNNHAVVVQVMLVGLK